MPATPASMFCDEVAVPRNVDNADLAPSGQRQPSKSEIDRHLARLFLLEAIRMDPGERGD